MVFVHNSAMTNPDEQDETAIYKATLLGSLLEFTKVFYRLRTGRKFEVSEPIGRESHHITICRELTKVFNLETNRLLINVPPGFGKSELVIHFIAWAMAHYPDSQFLYISYSQTLAAKHTYTIRQIIEMPHYKKLFNVGIRQDSSAKDNFKTDHGGSVMAFGSSGSITGQDAGLPNQSRFSGGVFCFPYEELVWTEQGPLKIGDIVENKLQVNVYSTDINTGITSLKPISDWYTNPGSEIIEIEFNDGSSIRCTPNHRIWTDNRGWVEANNLLANDSIRNGFSFNSFYKPTIYIEASSKPSNIFIGMNNLVDLFISKFFPEFIRINFSSFFCYFCPGKTNFNGAYSPAVNSISFSQNSGGVVTQANSNGIFSSELCARSIFIHGKRIKSLGVLDVLRFGSIGKIIKSIVFAISIQMSDLYSFCLRSNKRPCNKSVNSHCNRNFISRKINSIISFPRIIWRKLKYFFFNGILIPSIIFCNDAIFTSNSSQVRDAIKSFPSRNKSPLFIRNAGHADKTYCLNIKDNHTFYCGEYIGALVSNCDDMHKPDEVFSSTMRQGVIDNYNNTIIPRPRGINVPIVGIGQRLHEEDLWAKLIEGFDGYKWKTVILKAIDEAGNALNPAIKTLESLRIMQEKQPYVFSAQYQQDPIPAGGGIFKPEWFVILDQDPEIEATFITADTAETDKSYNDATVFSFWGVYRIKEQNVDIDLYGLHWIDTVELRVEPKDLESEFRQFYSECLGYKVQPKLAGIEKKSTGVTLISVLEGFRGLQILDIPRNKATGGKTARFLAIQPYVASKRVSFTNGAKHVDLCIEHCKKITANNTHRFDDIADTFADAVKMALIDQTVQNMSKKDISSNQIVRELVESFNITDSLREKAYGRGF